MTRLNKTQHQHLRAILEQTNNCPASTDELEQLIPLDSTQYTDAWWLIKWAIVAHLALERIKQQSDEDSFAYYAADTALNKKF